jgi:hypothetical protein
MKQSFNFQFISTIFFCLALISFFTTACNQKKEKNEAVINETKVSSDTLSQPATKDTQTANVPVKENAPEPKPVPPTPKICDPNFNLLGLVKPDQKVFYVSGFNPGEFKCWEELESYGRKTCGGKSCIIYYMDKPIKTFTRKPPHFIDDELLKTAGIGRFEYDGKIWAMKGSSQWGRKEKGYAYYNTNDAGGG